MKKIRLAFVKFGGLSAGGTEKFIQTIAAHLPKDEFEITFFYTDTAPYVGSDYHHAGTDPNREAYMREHGVRLVQVAVEAKDITRPTCDWVGTDFWTLFREEDFDLVQTARAGPPEFPFYQMRRIPIIDSLHYLGGIDNQWNTARVVHTSRFSLTEWVRRGGDAKRAVLVYHPIEIRPFRPLDYRRTYGLESKFVFGFHQRDDAHIFSPMMLEAFRRIAGPANHFMILGGSKRHRQQAADLGLTNVTFLEHSASPDVLYSFLSALQVFAHGRRDGEINSTAIAEALAFGLPVVTHYTDTYDGQVEGVGDAGFAAHTVDEYEGFLKRLESDALLYKDYSDRARRRFKDNYDLHTQVEKMRALYHDVMIHPFPHPWRRTFLAARQRVFPRAPSWMLRRAVLRLWNWVQFGRWMVGMRLFVRSKFGREKPETSFALHHDQYANLLTLDDHRRILAKYDAEDLFNHPANRLGNLLKANPGIRAAAVDIGCGNGWLAAKLSRSFRKVIGIEPSPAALESAAQLFPPETYPNIEWRQGLAEDQLLRLTLAEPALFVTAVVLSHLPDAIVARICAAVSQIAPAGSLLSFSECWGPESHEFMWHVRTPEWWQARLPDWTLDFHGPAIQNAPGRHKGFHGIKRGNVS